MGKPVTAPETDLEAIPAALRERPQWVIYRAVVRKNRKPTKAPYCAEHPRRKASTTDPATWATFEVARAAVAGRAPDEGLGYVFSAEDPFAGIDLDKCRDPDTGKVHPEAARIVAALDSYTEVSPSGTGLHVLVIAEVGGGRRTGKTPWGGELELYDRERYFTVTGALLPGANGAIAERNAQVEALRAELLPEPTPTLLHAPAAPVIVGDRDLLEKAFAARNGTRLLALWHGEANGYPSESEADLALLSMLAFWTGPDPARLDALFRQSARMRPKWEQREDYRTSTIARALNGREEFYSPATPASVKSTPAPAPAATSTSPLAEASAIIRMADVPLIMASERPGHVTLTRADGLTLEVPSLDKLGTFATLAIKLAGDFGHLLVVPRDEKTSTAHGFIAALRRHFGAAPSNELERRVEGWLIDLVRHSQGDLPFTPGDAESRMQAWRELDNLDPGETSSGWQAFARKVMFAYDTTTHDRYLRVGWAEEYLRRRGWRRGADEANGILEAVGLVKPNPRSGGRVGARWRASSAEVVSLRFWIVPPGHYDGWRA